jgi:hypothetical protein
LYLIKIQFKLPSRKDHFYKKPFGKVGYYIQVLANFRKRQTYIKNVIDYKKGGILLRDFISEVAEVCIKNESYLKD